MAPDHSDHWGPASTRTARALDEAHVVAKAMGNRVAIATLTVAASSLVYLTGCEPARGPSAATFERDGGTRPASPAELADMGETIAHFRKACARPRLHAPSNDVSAVPFKLVLRDKTFRSLKVKSLCLLLDDHALIPPGNAEAVITGLAAGRMVTLDTKLMPSTSHLVEMSVSLEGAGIFEGYHYEVTSHRGFGTGQGMTLDVDLYEAMVPQGSRQPKVAFREVPSGDAGSDSGTD